MMKVRSSSRSALPAQLTFFLPQIPTSSRPRSRLSSRTSASELAACISTARLARSVAAGSPSPPLPPRPSPPSRPFCPLRTKVAQKSRRGGGAHRRSGVGRSGRRGGRDRSRRGVWLRRERDRNCWARSTRCCRLSRVRFELALGYTQWLIRYRRAELDALRPKSPPQRNGLPSSGGLGRGRGAGLGITRSGLVGQAATVPAPDGSVGVNGLGRGRGRGRGRSSEQEAGYNIVPRPLPRQPPTTMYGPSLQAFTPQQQYFVAAPPHSNSAPPYPYASQLVQPPPPPPVAQYAYASQPSTAQHFYGVPPPPSFLSGYPQQSQAPTYRPPLHYPPQQQYQMPAAQGYYTPPYPASVQPSPIPQHPSLPSSAYAYSMPVSSPASVTSGVNPQLATQYIQQQMQTLALGQSTSSNSTAPSDAGSSAPTGELVYPISSRSRERTAESVAQATAADGRFADARE